MSRVAVVASCAGALLIGGMSGFWFASGMLLISTKVSPDGRERVELYSPPHWQTLGWTRFDLPGVARVTRLADGASLGTSDVFELSGSGGDVYFDTDVVQVSTIAVYRRSTGKWEIER